VPGDSPPPRQRLLTALDTLSQSQSVLDVGIDTILREAGVAKASLYQHFGSKEALLIAWLQRRQELWFGYFDEYIRDRARSGEPLAEVEAAFGFLEAWLAREDFAGCPFLTTFLQLNDSAHPVADTARSYADRLHRFFRSRLAQAGLKNSALNASSLLELFLGAVTLQQMAVGRNPARAARRTAHLLLRSLPKR
jgi:AcrR family transcriptional regulator